MNQSKKSSLFIIILLAITLIVPSIPQVQAESGEWQIDHDKDDCFLWNGAYNDNSVTIYWFIRGQTRANGFRWLNLNIPQGATIESAYMRWRATGAGESDEPTVVIRGEDADNAIRFVSSADFNARDRTDANVEYDIPATAYHVWYETNDLKTIIQEIINREGWESGNALVLFTDLEPANDFEPAFRAHDYLDGGSAPYLNVTWSAGPIPPSDPDLLFGAGFNTTSPYVELHWNHSLVDVQFFEVQNSSDGVSWTYLGQSNTANYTDSQVVNGTERYYKVRACNQTGGDWYNSSFTDVNFETVYFISDTEEAPAQINIPQIDAIEFNTTIAGEICGVTGKFSDVEGLAGYIFWNNATSPPGGVNSSFTALAGVSDSAIENITLPSSGSKLGVKYYVNDTDGNWAVDTLIIFPTLGLWGDFVCAPQHFNASSISVIVGTLNAGNLASTYFVDGDWYNVSEVVGPPGLDIRVNFTGVGLGPGCFEFYQTYTGHAHHAIDVQIWNFTSTSWNTIGPVFFNETANWACIGLGHNYEHFFSGGELFARFHIDGKGHVAHELHIDRITLAVVQADECPPPTIERVPVDDYSMIFLAMGLIFCLAIYFLYTKNK